MFVKLREGGVNHLKYENFEINQNEIKECNEYIFQKNKRYLIKTRKSKEES